MTSDYFYMTMAKGVDEYDEFAALTCRAYSCVHQCMTSILTARVRNSDELPLIIDVGCGTGAELFPILAAIPAAHVLCIDVSPSMLDSLENALSCHKGAKEYLDRCTLVNDDFQIPGWIARSLRELPASITARKCTAIVSAYALHHLSPAKKQIAYEEIANTLRPNCPFVNADLFSHEAPWLAEHFQHDEEEWIRSQFSACLDACRDDATETARINALMQQWLLHVRHENHPLPVHSINRETVCEDSLLRAAGFTRRYLAFRCSQTAILWSEKGEANE